MYNNQPNLTSSVAGNFLYGNNPAMMAGMSCGITITDPRLQPYLKAVREEHVQFNAQVFMSNGYSKAAAYAEAEKYTADRSQFYNQALIRYLESLNQMQNLNVNQVHQDNENAKANVHALNYYYNQFLQQSTLMQSMPSTTATPVKTEPFKKTAMPQPNIYTQNGVPYKMNYINYPYYGNSLVAPSTVDPPMTLYGSERNQLPLFKSAEHLQPHAASVPKADSSNSVASFLANVQINLNNTRKSRFDVSTFAVPPQTASSCIFAPMFNKAAPKVLSVPPIKPSNPALERLIQQWTYKVYSQMQTQKDSKAWRNSVCEFVTKHTNILRETYTNSELTDFPEWLTYCIVPTVSEVMGTVPDSFVLHPSKPPVDPPAAPKIDKKPYNKKTKRRFNVPSSNDSDSGNSENSDKIVMKKPNLQSKESNVAFVKPKRNFKQKLNLFTLPEIDSEVVTVEELKRRGDRMRRFGLDDISNTNQATDLSLLPWQERLDFLTSLKRVIGESTALEKPYLRLCGPCNPQDVRPENILKKSFDHCLKKYRETQKYHFIEEQFRSIRQDLTVQGIRNEFTVHVYETNARIALENSDLGQFNQCQTQLRELHKRIQSHKRTEFLCYRLLYLSLTNMRQDCLNLLDELHNENLISAENFDILFALNFRKALIEGNYARVFRMSNEGPHLSRNLIKVFSNRLKMMYLCTLAKSHYTLSIYFLSKALMFLGVEECRKFLKEHDAVWISENDIDCRKSVQAFESSPFIHTRKLNALGKRKTMELTYQMALEQDLVYVPPNTTYIPYEVIERAGMSTTYDSRVVPTFEAELRIKKAKDNEFQMANKSKAKKVMCC